MQSLLAAAIGGGANAMLGAIAMPDTFNLTHAGLLNLAKITVIGILVPVLTLLKQSPLPTTTASSTTTLTTETKVTPSPEKLP